ncbi:MAG: hypothetical protein VX127_16615 [Myxococcota bacterium]|nr:hypothetical protein [Myxococcota bacterium]
MSVWVVLAGVAVAEAGPVDIHGFGAASMGRGSGGVAVADGGMTVFRNPALLHELEWAEATVGYAVNRSSFPAPPALQWDTNRDGLLNGDDEPLRLGAERTRADGAMVSMARNVGGRVGIALNAFMPAGRFLRLRTTEPALPAWIMHGNRTQRLELAVGLGAEVYRGVSVGVSTELVGHAKYRINGTIDIAAGAADDGDGTAEDLVEHVRVDVHDMTLDLMSRFVPMIGIYWDVEALVPALKGSRIAATWRGSGGVPVDADIDLQINGTVTEIGDLDSMSLALVLPVELSIFDHFVPQRWSVGWSHQHQDAVRGYVDVHATRWSAMRVNVAHLSEAEIRSQLFDLDDDLLVDANEYSVQFDDTLSVHAGVEVMLPGWTLGPKEGPVMWVGRAGAAHIPSPLAAQGPETSFLDADRILASGGLGIVHRDALGLVPGPVAWDAFFATQWLAKGSLVPEDETRPGAPVNGQAIPVGGQLWSAGVQCSVSF